MPEISADLTQSFFDRLDRAQGDRVLGARLEGILSSRARIWSHWGNTDGPSEAEMAVLPLMQALEGGRLQGEDLIWMGNHARVAAGRWRFSGRMVRDGPLGRATDHVVSARVASELYLIDDMVAEGVVVMDTSTALLQADIELKKWARDRALTVEPKLPEPPQATAQNVWADGWAQLLQLGMSEGVGAMAAQYAQGCIVDWPGARLAHGRGEVEQFWSKLRNALPSAKFTLCHRVGRSDPMMPPRASVRWRLTGKHDGWGLFGAPTGAMVSVVGISQAEFGDDGVKREFTIFDEAAVWAQIFGQTGAIDDRTGAGPT